LPLDYTKLRDDFHAHLQMRGLHFVAPMVADALACFISSQFLLLAGPSGTGKSSLARALASFFSDRSSVIDSEPGLVRPQDLAGYASGLSGPSEFVATPATKALQDLVGSSDNPPVLIVEEANVSPIEGYLAPLTHGLSTLRTSPATWTMHSQASALPVRGDSAAPHVRPSLELKPFPRLLATINVDASAPAPANKVSARAAVLLLEPPTTEEAVSLPSPTNQAPVATAPPGYGTVGDPTDCLLARLSSQTDGVLRDELKAVTGDALEDARRMSPRMAQRALMYQAAYEAVCANEGGALEQHRSRHAAENALLHFLLPVLSPIDFTQVAQRLAEKSQPDGLLFDRLSTLRLDEEDWRQAPDDFWSGLS
jgi:energy-coupling factor transporter ATP-binding protein EcfA2